MKKISKMCSKCKLEYPATSEYFRRDKTRYDRLFPWCKKCKREVDKKYHLENIIEINKQRKEWRENNKEITKIRDKKYSEKMKARKPEDIFVPKTKKCIQCGKTKLSSGFYKDINAKGGLTGSCKECSKIKNRNSYQKHKEKRKIYERQYSIDNKLKISKRAKKYYCNNREKIQRYKNKWHKKNKKSISEKQKSWRMGHKDWLREYAKNRKKNDLNYRMLCNFRSRLNHALKSQNCVRRACHTKKIIGCSMDELRRHMQSKFLKGMTWNNYGKGYKKWSIDHIVPCAAFNLLDFKQQKKCFHYANLQPLWNKDNHEKNSLYNGKYIRKNREVKQNG